MIIINALITRINHSLQFFIEIPIAQIFLRIIKDK